MKWSRRKGREREKHARKQTYTSRKAGGDKGMRGRKRERERERDREGEKGHYALLRDVEGGNT